MEKYQKLKILDAFIDHDYCDDSRCQHGEHCCSVHSPLSEPQQTSNTKGEWKNSCNECRKKFNLDMLEEYEKPCPDHKPQQPKEEVKGTKCLKCELLLESCICFKKPKKIEKLDITSLISEVVRRDGSWTYKDGVFAGKINELIKRLDG